MDSGVMVTEGRRVREQAARALFQKPSSVAFVVICVPDELSDS